MQSLNSWIEAQLKKGYRKEQIKRALIRKGYPQNVVAEVDKIGYSALPARTLPSKKNLSKPIALVSIVIGIVFLIWLFNVVPFFSEQQNLCGKFKGTDYKITCSKAVELALANTPGTVQNVSIDSVRTIDPSTEPPSRITADMWLVDVKLEKPYFDQSFNREIHVARIGVGLNEHSGIYKEVLE